MKMCLIDNFVHKINSPACDFIGMPLTKATNCGIRHNSPILLVSFDLPPNLYGTTKQNFVVGKRWNSGELEYKRH